MNALELIRKINFKVNKRKMSVYNIDYETQLDLISKMNEPNDLIERSYNQYKCQGKNEGIIIRLLYSIGSFFLIIPFLMKFSIAAKRSKLVEMSADAVALLDFEKKGLLPPELKKEFKIIKVYKDAHGILDGDDLQFIGKFFLKYIKSPYFLFKCILRISIYSDIRVKYNPIAILAYAEYSFTSSLLTEYCRYRKINHINIMHGEKLINIRDSFFCFDRFYIWDEHYIDIFRKMRADMNQFIVTKPPAVKFEDVRNRRQEKHIDFKYYLAHPSDSELKTIAGLIDKLITKGFKVKVRPHPLLLELDLINKYFPRNIIEFPNEISIEMSIFETDYVIAEYSTVLYQAYNCEKNIVIDDLTYPEHYDQLKNLDYIMISKPHQKLSNILIEDGN